MGDLFRSEEMVLGQLFIQPEVAYATIAAFGENACAQFRDLNNDINKLQRKYASEVQRSDELERRVRYIETELKKNDIKLPVIEDEEEPPAPTMREIIDMENQLESIETETYELTVNSDQLQENYKGLLELQQVLGNADKFFAEGEVIQMNSQLLNNESNISDVQARDRAELGFVAGIIDLKRFFAFERMLWRISHGNIFVRRWHLYEENENEKDTINAVKTVFVAFFQGDELKHRIKKICAGFHATLYSCPSVKSERDQIIRDVKTRAEDIKMILNQTVDHKIRALVAASTNLPRWAIMVKKMKAIYHTLNNFNVDISNKCLVGEAWIPKCNVSTVQKALDYGSKMSTSTMQSFLNIVEAENIATSTEPPPTYIRTNKFTRAFQNLIDAYGVNSYREVNPALYTCITFPFLFAVMYGDMGHAVLLLICGLALCINEKEKSKIKDEIFSIFFAGRYIIVLMALFSLYTGFIYNDVFSKSLNIFGSAWRVRYNTTTVLENPVLTMDPKYQVYGVYPMGLDPVWQLDAKKIIFLNSFKMKLSIIFGVVHMIFGLIMSLINFSHTRKFINIIMEFVPQLLFLLLLFGYLVFMMFFKWAKYSAKSDDLANTPGCAPSILILFINMMLFGHTKPLEGCKEYMFEGEYIMEYIFVAVALLCIPWMLLGKPLYILHNRRMQMEDQSGLISNSDYAENITNETPRTSSASAALENVTNEEPMSEIFTHQAIHTIEYVLSTISHTASYLRLWALSLAHAQLADILWEKLITLSLILFPGYFGAPLIFIVFSAWAFLTVNILVIIEGLSAFLHTLRLHWVEFMSKFYDGNGYAFQPFSFKTILEEDEQLE